MNQLDPELKRLIGWARPHETVASDPPPIGFVVRVAARGREELLATEPAWGHRLRWGFAWVSLLIAAGGVVYWNGQRQPSNNAYNFAPAYFAAAKNITP